MTNRKLTEFQEAWLTALESGDYPQGRSRLKTTKGYCCLGVACEISNKGKWRDNENGVYSYITMDSSNTYSISNTGYLPTAVIDILDLTPPGERNCTALNDTDKITFVKIAAKIRANPENYFHKS